jgi:glutamyl-tRNA synthetase
MPNLKERAKTLIELAESAVFYARMRPMSLTPKAEKNSGRDSKRESG